MANAEEVVINILANDIASSKLEGIRKKLESIANLQNSFSQNTSFANQSTINTGTQQTEKITKQNEQVQKLSESYKNTGKSAEDLGKKTISSLKLDESTFHALSGMLDGLGGKFQNLSMAIAGVFGASGLSGMIEKMWKGASERQTNMLYLIHQKGVSQAKAYYNEIMDIVTQLPGDDTFLTNILNMASALDKNIKMDNLKELGTTITDYYIASTMKGENAFEVQKDLRKYITQGDTKMIRNSIIASEIDSLKNKNTVLERTIALQKALDKLGFSGMSEYDSATNELEEFKGHFQKAFADLGDIVISVIQPLLKFYNTLDTVFGSRISQLIILLSTAFIGLFAIIGTGMIVLGASLRTFEVLGYSITTLTWMISHETTAYGLLNDVIILLIGSENAERISKEGNVLATIKNTFATYRNTLAKRLNVSQTELETISTWGLVSASMSNVKAKIIEIATTIKRIIVGQDELSVTVANEIAEGSYATVIGNSAYVKSADNVVTASNTHEKLMNTWGTIKNTLAIIPNTLQKWLSGEASLSEAFAEEINSNAKVRNTLITIMNTLSKLKGIAKTILLTSVTIINAGITALSTETTFADALAHEVDANMKVVDTEATYGLATATAILESELAPILAIVLLIIGAIVALVIVIEKIGEALGWWKDFGSMFQAISDGINRMWEAFINSDIVQAVINYFKNFIETLQDLFGVIGKIFGFAGRKFDIVQSYIDAFAMLEGILKRIWNMLDTWANSPLGIITWINPIGILIFHLDELGSYFEDVRDAMLQFAETTEFQELVDEFNEVMDEIKEPLQEIWDAISEVISAFDELFNGDQENGTEDRINLLVGALKVLSFVIRATIIPAIHALAFVIKLVSIPIQGLLLGIKSIIDIIKWASQIVEVFGAVWEAITSPLQIVYSVLEGIGNMINQVSDAIKNSPLGKLFGWDKEEDKDDEKQKQLKKVQDNLYATVQSSNDIDPLTKQGMLNELNKQRMTSDNINNVRNLGSTYNHNDNQRQVVINQNFAEGSMPIDARNMTKKEARKMFINAFGYRRAVGYNGILK